MVEDIILDAKIRMNKSIEALKNELAKIRTGRANPGLLEHIVVPYYGTDTPLNQVSSISVADARTLTVTPFEKPLLGDIEKAILKSDLGLNPITSGENIRIPLPPLTEERRRDMTKQVKQIAESSRVSIRNVRRDMNQQFKELLHEKLVSEDENHKAEDKAQKVINDYVQQVDQICEQKEKDLMSL